MKNTRYIITLLIVLASCGRNEKKKTLDQVINSGSLIEMRDTRGQLMTDYSALQNELKVLDEAIAKLDTLKKLPLITVLKVKDTIFKHYLELQGNVATKQNMVLFPETPGLLNHVYVKEGQWVKKGQTLASVDDGGLNQQVAQLEIQASLAKTTYERQQRLWEQKIGSELQFLQSRASYEAQEKAILQLKNQMAKTSIRAPFSGTIDEIITEQGTVVAPGQTPILRIVSLGSMYIEADVPERYIASIKKGTDVSVVIPVLGETITSKIKQLGNFIDPVSRSFKIEVPVSNKQKSIKPNMTSKLKLNDYTNEKALLIPQSMLSEDSQGQQYVYVIAAPNANGEAIAKRVFVETGLQQEDLIEVSKGIASGDALIQEGARSVKDGQTVKILAN